MNSAFSSFALIKNSFDDGEDYIGAYTPLLLQLFMKKSYTNITIETICNDFEVEYGFGIPRHPMETILNRMKPKYLVKDGLTITINVAEVKKSAGKIDFQNEIQKYDWLIENFIEFCNKFQSQIKISHEDADSLFIDFLKEHDLEIIFAAYEGDESTSLFSNKVEVNESDKRFLLNRYINMLMRQGGDHAEYVLRCAIGHNYASTILYREFTNVRGKGTCANYYLDVGILFDLLGINRNFRKKAAIDFLSLLRKKGSTLHIFRHNYEEFLRIIENCLTWIDSDYYDPEKTSRTLQFFKDEGFTSTDINLFIANIPIVLDKNQIEVVDTIDPNIRQEYQISRETFKNQLLEFYKSDGHYVDAEEKDSTIERDVTSVENIYKLRGNIVPTSLNNAAHVLITSNASLAYTSALFERNEFKRGYFTIPTVLTDTFVGTFIWVQEPAKIVEDFNKSKLIAYTNAVIYPKPNLLRRFTQEVEIAKRNTVNPISDESALLLLENSLARYLLADKTLGDPDRVTAQTPYEVLEELKHSLVLEEKAKTKDSLRSLEDERIGKEKAEERLEIQTANIQNWINIIAVWGKRVVVGLLFILALVFLAINEFQEPKSALTKIVYYCLALISAVSGITITVLGTKTEEWICNKLGERLLPPQKKIDG
jgi:hypothetical protein